MQPELGGVESVWLVEPLVLPGDGTLDGRFEVTWASHRLHGLSVKQRLVFSRGDAGAEHVHPVGFPGQTTTEQRGEGRDDVGRLDVRPDDRTFLLLGDLDEQWY